MTIQDACRIFKIEDLAHLPAAVMHILFSEKREEIFEELTKLNPDFSFDWFQSLYEDELAQRSQNKQDFTPNTIGILLSQLTGTSSGKIYEPAAGNGSLIIAHWWHKKNNSDNYSPEEHPVECWDLSARSVPILLLNLSIRGIIGEVYHGDVLTREVRARYKLISDNSRYSKIEKTHENDNS